MAKGQKRERHDSGKQPAKKTGSGQPEKTYLEFGGEAYKLTPTADYPFQVLETAEYQTWIDGIVDTKTNARITSVVSRMRRGLFSDWKEVGGVFEMRIDFGPGYRVYYVKQGKTVVILLGGGDKASQQKDMKAARTLWERLKNEITEL